jgi:lipopolysaccharide export system permease protein
MTIRPRLSPTIDRFLAGTFFGPFLVCLAAFTAAYLLGDIFDRFDTLVHHGGLGILGLAYFALKIPLIVTQLLPIACLAGVLLGFALLNRTGEVLACQQLGVSRIEMMIPVLLIGALISGFQFALSETVVPAAAREAKYLFEVELKGRQLEGVFANRHLWIRVRDGFLSADSYNHNKDTLNREKSELLGVTLYRIAPDYGVTNIFHADSADWNGKAWVPHSVTRYRLTAGAVSSSEPAGFVINVTPADLGLLRLEPEEFSIWELNRYIHDLKQKGLDPGGYLVDRDLKYAMPLSCLIMVALGIALSLDPLPRHLSLGRSFGLAILIGFGYWLAAGLTSSLGHSGFMPAWFAAWSPNLLFTMLASGIFLFGEER